VVGYRTTFGLQVEITDNKAKKGNRGKGRKGRDLKSFIDHLDLSRMGAFRNFGKLPKGSFLDLHRMQVGNSGEKRIRGLAPIVLVALTLPCVSRDVT